MKHAGRIIFYVVVAVGAGIWIQNRRETVLEHNRKVLADDAAALSATPSAEMCDNLQPLAKRVQAEIKSCRQEDDWVTVTVTSYRRDAFGDFLWEVGTTGFAQIDTKDKTNYFREMTDSAGRQHFEHTFHLQYKLDDPAKTR